MQKKTTNQEIKEKLEYIGLDFDNIPKRFEEMTPLKLRITKSYDETKHRQYRYIPISDIQILLSPTNRLEELEEKYKKASSLLSYLRPQDEEDIIKHTTFLNMIQKVRIEDIEKIEEEQKELNKKIPFKVKYSGNYLWQIYYSENTDQYFMLVPTEDTDYSTFFYLLKKQLEKRRTGKIFVPVSHIGYSTNFFKKSEFEDIENYLWLFTKDWPFIYEVFDKKDNLTLQIVGETEVHRKIKSPYRIIISNKEEANQFYKLLKALFILQTELPKYYQFSTNIDKQGSIEFYYENKNIQYEDLTNYLKEQYVLVEELENTAVEDLKKLREKLNQLKEIESQFELEYIVKEKQITTYLECKKTFFGKVKYFFKYKKKDNKNFMTKEVEKILEEEIEESNLEQIAKEKIKEKEHKNNYTLEELIQRYKEYEVKENEIKNILLDINALKLRNKNLKKKIENATQYIAEIDNHKRSIFEFWKYSNKDEMSTLSEGEKEEVGVEHKITKRFDYEEDLERFGTVMDKIQRQELSREELDSIYITTTNVLAVLNKVKVGEIDPKEIEKSLKKIKEEAKEQKILWEKDEFDIFGGAIEDSTRIKKIKDKKHREIPKDKFKILDINKQTKQLGYKLTLENVLDGIKKATSKIKIEEEIPVYKICVEEKLRPEEINIFDLNPEKEIDKIMEAKGKIYFYEINLKENTNAIAYTNSIYYDNKNRTLPVGMDVSTNVLVDVSNLELKLKAKKTFRIVEFENKDEDCSKVNVKTINVLEYDSENRKTE